MSSLQRLVDYIIECYKDFSIIERDVGYNSVKWDAKIKVVIETSRYIFGNPRWKMDTYLNIEYTFLKVMPPKEDLIQQSFNALADLMGVIEEPRTSLQSTFMIFLVIFNSRGNYEIFDMLKKLYKRKIFWFGIKGASFLSTIFIDPWVREVRGAKDTSRVVDVLKRWCERCNWGAA